MWDGHDSKGWSALLRCQPHLSYVMVWKREVILLSTIHRPFIVHAKNIDCIARKRKWKPTAVVDYNINMRLVGKSDAMISSIEYATKNMKWFWKLFFHLLDMTTHISHILDRAVTGVQETCEAFIVELVRELLSMQGAPRTPSSPSLCRRNREDTPKRLTESHFITFEKQTEGRTERDLQRRCNVCSHTQGREKISRKLIRYEVSFVWCVTVPGKLFSGISYLAELNYWCEQWHQVQVIVRVCKSCERNTHFTLLSINSRYNCKITNIDE